MRKYCWKGIDSFGENKKGVLSATSKDHLSTLLLEQGIALLDCQLEGEKFFNKINFFRNINLEQKVFFLNQLAILVESGVDLLKALKVVCRQIESKKFKKVILQIIDDVASGMSFSSALEKFSDIFSSSMVYVIRSGEHSGNLGFVLKNLANYFSERLVLKNKLKKAALLPCLTLSFAFLIIWGVFVFVIPQFESLFSSMGKEIPASTKFVMKISEFLRSNYFFVVLLFFIVTIFGVRFILRKNSVRIFKDKLLLNIYGFYKIFLLSDLISFLQSLALFLRTGVNLSNALELSINTVQNSCLKEKVFQLKEYVIQGKSFEEALTLIGSNFFPDNLIAVVAVGEQAGNLDLMLQKAAFFFQDDLSNYLQTLLTIFQPVLMIFIGLLIAFLMLSVYMPIFNMASLL